MFKPSASLQLSARRRLPLTTKQAGRGFYKGNRVGSMGTFEPFGRRFIINPKKVRTYVVPNLKGFKLTPFVSNEVGKPKPVEEYKEYKNGPISGEYYLSTWKRLNRENPSVLDEGWEEPE